MACTVSRLTMKTLAAITIFLLTMSPVQAQKTDLTGKWAGTLTRTAPDGRTQSIDFLFDLTHKGKVLTGTAGPNPERQWPIEKGVVDGTQVTFQVQLEFKGQTAAVKVDMGRAK